VDEGLVSQAVLDQGTVLRALHDAGVPPWLELDLTIGQLRALYALFRSGPLPIGQLGAALGPDKVGQLSKQVGVPVDQLLPALAAALPTVIDALTPDGQMPGGGGIDIGGVLGGLGGLLGGDKG